MIQSIHDRLVDSRASSRGQLPRRSRPAVLRKYENALAVHEIEPLEDHRWVDFLQRHPRSSLFHTVPWLEALRHTYGYEPIAYTTSSGTDLQNALLFCRVNSWLTGHRLVSVPFSDHCDPLVDDGPDLKDLTLAIQHQLFREKLRYIEIRPLHAALKEASSLFQPTRAYCFHQLDLRPDLDTLYSNCHKSTRRNIRRAEREGLIYEHGCSKSLLDAFFSLYVLTRRRHQAPPQPKAWFVNLIDGFGESLKIRVASRNGQALAAVLTLRYRDTLTYKYGGSDPHFNNLGGTHFLIWQMIQEAKKDGLRVLDLGRSEYRNQGLVTFKDRLGGAPSTLTYSRFTSPAYSRAHHETGGNRWGHVARAVVSNLPDRMFCAVGSLVYKHIG